MTQTTTTQAPPAIGSFCWFELHTRNVDAVTKFYGELCAWDTYAVDMGGFTYHHWRRAGVDFGGMMDMNSPEWGDAPSHWMSYIRVADVDASAAKVTELGGSVCVPPTDIPNVGRFCVINDPTGATISLMRWDDPEPLASVIVWNELLTRDPHVARTFYTKLLGWTTEDMSMGDHGDYIVCKNGDVSIGGIFEMNGPQFEHVPPHWLNYIATEDVDRDAAKVKELGGNVIVPPTDIPNSIGRFSVITDPDNGHIALYQCTGQ